MIASSSKKEIRDGAILSYVSIFLNIISGLTFTPWMINELGTSTYGLYSLIISLVALVSTDLGLRQTTVKFLSKYKAEYQKNKESIFLNTVLRLYIVLDIFMFFVMLLIFIFMNNIFIDLTTTEIEQLKVGFCIAALFTLITFPLSPIEGVLASNERFVFIKFLDITQKVIIVVMMVFALILGFGLYALVLVNIFAKLMVKIYSYYYAKNEFSLKVDVRKINVNLYRPIFNTTGWLTLPYIAKSLTMQLMPSLIASLVGSVQVSVFAIGMIMSGYVYTFSSAISGLFLPIITKQITKGESPLILAIKVGRVQLMILGLLCIGLILVGDKFITLWVGKEFGDSYYIALFLSLPYLITLTQEIFNTALLVIEKIKYRSIVLITEGVICLVLSYILTQKMQAKGAAIAIFLSVSFMEVFVLNVVYVLKTDFDIFHFFKACHLKLLPVLMGSFFLSKIMCSYIVHSGWISLVVQICIIVCTYITIIWFLGMNNSEKELGKSVFRKVKLIFIQNSQG